MFYRYGYVTNGIRAKVTILGPIWAQPEVESMDTNRYNDFFFVLHDNDRRGN